MDVFLNVNMFPFYMGLLYERNINRHCKMQNNLSLKFIMYLYIYIYKKKKLADIKLVLVEQQ